MESIEDKNRSKKKKLKTFGSDKIKVYSKDSFDRFGDDLCEFVLNYLSVSDKIWFECVSKQWKRLLFNKQKKLIIFTKYSDIVLNKEMKQKLQKYNGFDEDFNTIKIRKHLWLNNGSVLIKQLFTKFKSINNLQIEGFSVDNKLMNELIENCNHLTNVFINSYNISVNTYQKFVLKFGKTLKSLRINFIGDKELEEVLKMTPNLETIYLSKSFKVLSKQFLPKLQQIYCREDNDLESLSDKYMNQIRKIKFSSYQFPYVISNARKSQLVSQFSNLQELSLSFGPNEPFFANCLDLIADNCKQLKVLTLSLSSMTFNGILFEKLSKFLCLEKLTIFLFSNVFYTYIEDKKVSKICSNLKYFSIIGVGLSDNDLNVIYLCVPNLRVFYLNCRFDAINITDKTLDNLSKMQNLRKVCIKTNKYFPFITDSAVEKFFRNSSKIKNISIRYKLEVIQTFVPLIERAKSDDKNEFTFDFFVDSLSDHLSKRKTLSIPNNLKIFAFHKRNGSSYVCSETQIWHLDDGYNSLTFNHWSKL